MESNKDSSSTTLAQDPHEIDAKPDTDFVAWQFSGWFIVHLLFMLIVLVVCEASSLLWQQASVFLYGLLFFFSLVVLLGARIQINDAVELENEFAMVVTYMIAGIFSISQLSRHLALISGGYIANNYNYWHWLRLGVSNILEAVLFDIPQIYEWNISEIRATTFGTRSILFVFRTSLEFIIVASILDYAGKARKHWKLEGKDSVGFISFIIRRLGVLFLVTLSMIPCAVIIGAIINEGLSFRTTWEVVVPLVPLLFGGWLIINSLEGLRISGVTNKLLCLGGIGIGGWLIWKNWDILKSMISQ